MMMVMVTQTIYGLLGYKIFKVTFGWNLSSCRLDAILNGVNVFVCFSFCHEAERVTQCLACLLCLLFSLALSFQPHLHFPYVHPYQAQLVNICLFWLIPVV